MNKRVKKKQEVKYDGSEDIEIKKIAHYSYMSQYILFGVLIILFGFTLYSSLVYVGKYYNATNNEYSELIEIRNDKDKIVVTNNGELNKTLTIKDDNNGEDVIVRTYDTIEIDSKDYQNINNYFFDIRYDIIQNDYSKNLIASSDSDVLVRFAYSKDNKEWTYINNAIKYNDINITPLIGALYDLSGIVGNIKVATKFNVKTNPYEKVKIYWKSETIIKYKKDNLGKNIKANFKINYNSMD